MMHNNDRQFWADTLKIVSVMGVILIHSAAPLLVLYNQMGSGYWWSGNIYNSASRWCIPVFFMLSGTFLLGKANGMSVTFFFKRRAQRIVVPFFIWSGIYFFWRINVNGEPLPLLSFFGLLLNGPVYYHLWFFYILVVLYILTPVLSSYLNGAKKSNLAYLLILWALFATVLPVIQTFWGDRSYPSDTDLNSAPYYIGYFILGYVLRDVHLGKKFIFVLALVFTLGLLVTAYGTYYLTVVQNNGIFNDLFYHYFSFNVVLMSIAVFLLIKSVNYGNRGVSATIVRNLAVCVPGIFLIHAIVIAILNRGYLGFTLTQSTINPAAGVPVFAIIVFAVSLLIVFVIRKIPLLRYIVP